MLLLKAGLANSVRTCLEPLKAHYKSQAATPEWFGTTYYFLELVEADYFHHR